MNITLVIDADTRQSQTHVFGSEYGIEEIRWEPFHDRPERLFAQQDAYVGDSTFSALFLNTLTVEPHVIHMLADNGTALYISVTSRNGNA